MTAPKLKRGKAPNSLLASTLDTLQLNSMSFLLELPLDKIVKICLYNFCKNPATLILLAPAAVRTHKDYQLKTRNTVPIDAILIMKL